jgi:hypothetical protein
LEADVDVEASVAGRLRVPRDAELIQERLQRFGGAAHGLEVRARLGVEIEPELVAVLRILGEVRPDVEAEATEVDRPDHVRAVGDDERS